MKGVIIMEINSPPVQSTINNTIRREVGCFAKEIIKGNDIYYIADINLTDSTINMLTQLDAIEVDSVGDIVNKNISVKDVLIVITESSTKTINDITKEFKNENGRITLLTTNRQSIPATLASEILGINIDKDNMDKATEIFKIVANYWLEKIREKVLKVEF